MSQLRDTEPSLVRSSSKREKRSALRAIRYAEAERKKTRRKLILGTLGSASLIGGGLLLAHILRRSEQESPLGEAQEKPQAGEGVETLKTTIAELPPSPIKALLMERVLEYYRTPPPKTVKRGGLEFTVRSPTVLIVSAGGPRVEGSIRMRSARSGTDALYPIRSEELRVPYLGLLLEHEQGVVPKKNVAPDGTPFIRVEFPPTRPLFEGIAPEITIHTFQAVTEDDAAIFTAIEKFAYIKEACTLLLTDILFEETVRKMRELEYPTHIESRRRTGATLRAEAVTQALQTLNNTGGRLLASIDIAGYLLAFKAIEGTHLLETLAQETEFRSTIAEVKTADYGSTPQDLYYRSLRHALTSQEAQRLFHDGEIGLIP